MLAKHPFPTHQNLTAEINCALCHDVPAQCVCTEGRLTVSYQKWSDEPLSRDALSDCLLDTLAEIAMPDVPEGVFCSSAEVWSEIIYRNHDAHLSQLCEVLGVSC